MDIRMGDRGLLFTFYELGIPTNIVVLFTKNTYIVIDTYLGETYIKRVLEYTESYFGKKNIIAINSHYDWDHIWGNSYFKDSLIIGHNLTYKKIKKYGEKQLEENKEYARESISLTLPNILFNKSINLKDFDIEIFHSPGHTKDSISIYDSKNKTLFVGDNVEKPIPYIQSKNLLAYKNTLNRYINMDVDHVLGGHILLEDKDIIISNLQYVEKLISGEKIIIEDEEFLLRHEKNLEFLMS